jgi:hypothetical protein
MDASGGSVGTTTTGAGGGALAQAARTVNDNAEDVRRAITA